jgi:hypothetical protein
LSEVWCTAQKVPIAITASSIAVVRGRELPRVRDTRRKRWSVQLVHFRNSIHACSAMFLHRTASDNWHLRFATTGLHKRAPTEPRLGHIARTSFLPWHNCGTGKTS